MNKLIIFLFICCLHLQVRAQSSAERKEKVTHSDSATYLSSAAKQACSCLDSISVARKSSDSISAEIARCIDDKVITLQLMYALLQASTAKEDKQKTINININFNKQSDSYIQTYRQIERWLKDSCGRLAKLLVANNSLSEKSYSQNEDAIDAYGFGVKFMDEQNYADAIPFFEKAVQIDPQFAFAWDNIGICYRKIGNYEKAIAAYRKSLEIDPKGVTPLHNLPVVFELQKEYDLALAGYKQLAQIFPEDAEAYFGPGRIYFIYKKDNEKALDYLCKAYLKYIQSKSPYRVDAENIISLIYKEMKAQNKTDVFDQILKDNNISTK
ncbi:MAG: hypothetical protein RLY16_1117 [Bacteroidota bacterium]|jgi:tetratricopeptide (TPR) repeat protein